MTIELWKDKEPYPSRTYTSTLKYEVKKVRRQWLKDIKNLKGTFYIIIKP